MTVVVDLAQFKYKKFELTTPGIRPEGEEGETYTISFSDFEQETKLEWPALMYAFQDYKDSGCTFYTWWRYQQ